MIPGLGRSPGEGNGYPLQYSGLENSMDESMWLQRVGHNRATFTSNFTSNLPGLAVANSPEMSILGSMKIESAPKEPRDGGGRGGGSKDEGKDPYFTWRPES